MTGLPVKSLYTCCRLGLLKRGWDFWSYLRMQKASATTAWVLASLERRDLDPCQRLCASTSQMRRSEP